ncbi:MAG: DNA polymerase IV, partial [Patescibacteria group bacterium]
MNKKIILHIDMNSYFASVEQQANPFLRGKPVGVCAYLSPGGCIIASSMEAKAKGIKTGMRVSQALEIDKKVVLLENEPAKYRSTTEKIFKILKSYTDRVEPYSIDEAFLDLT